MKLHEKLESEMTSNTASKVVLRDKYLHNPKITIVATKEKDLNLQITDGYGGVSLHDKEIWWLFEQLHILYNKTIGDF